MIALSVLFVLFTRSHRWMKVRNARVFYNDVVSRDASVYRGPTGELLIRLDGELYLVSRSRSDVGVPNRSEFCFVPGFALSRHVRPPVVLLNSAKAEVDPKLIFAGNTVEFTSFRGARIRVALNF